MAAEKLSNLQHASKSCDVVDVNCDAIQGAHTKVIEAIERAEQLHAEAADLKAKEAQVRKTPSWPRSWANFSLFSCIPTGRHGPTCNFWANLTHFSLTDRGDGPIRRVVERSPRRRPACLRRLPLKFRRGHRWWRR